MSNRMEWDKLEIEINRKLNIPMSHIKRDIFRMNSIMRMKKKLLIQELMIYMRCQRHFETALANIMYLVDPTENVYIEKEMESYYLLMANIGRFNKRIDEMLKQAISESLIPKGAISSKRIRESLKEAEEIMTYRPMFNAYVSFNEMESLKSGKSVKKDKKLFGYLLFLELLKSSFLLGPITREEELVKKANVQQINPSTYFRTSSKYPSNLEYEDTAPEENPYENMFLEGGESDES